VHPIIAWLLAETRLFKYEKAGDEKWNVRVPGSIGLNDKKKERSKSGETRRQQEIEKGAKRLKGLWYLREEDEAWGNFLTNSRHVSQAQQALRCRQMGSVKITGISTQKTPQSILPRCS